jgi:hypothetical protein
MDESLKSIWRLSLERSEGNGKQIDDDGSFELFAELAVIDTPRATM